VAYSFERRGSHPSLGLQHVACRQAFGLAGRQVRSVAPRADRLSHAQVFPRSWILQDRKPQRLCALRAPRSRASRALLLCEKCGRSDEIEDVKLDRLLREAAARGRLCPAPANGRARGPVPELRSLAYEAETDLRLAEMGHDPFGAGGGRICNRRCSLPSGARFANRRMGACRQQRTGRPR